MEGGCKPEGIGLGILVRRKYELFEREQGALGVGLAFLFLVFKYPNSSF